MEQPRPQGGIEPRLDRERRIALKQALEALGDHPRLGQGQDVAGANQARNCRASCRGRPVHARPGSPASPLASGNSARRADDSAADHDRMARHSSIHAHCRIPIAKGSAGSMISVDSALTYAVPRIRGRMRPSTIRTDLRRRCRSCSLAARSRPRGACRRHSGTRAWRWCRCRRGSGRRPCRGRARSSCCRRPAQWAGRRARCGRSRPRQRP